jgi:hypothetical protein
MIYALLWTLFYAIANTLIKYVSTNFDMYKNLFFQYSFVSIYWFLLVLIFDHFKFDFLPHIFLFSMIWLSGFLWIWALMNWMKYLSNGVIFIVANLYVILWYFVNNYFFPSIESFSYMKIILWIAFFLIISILLFEKDEEQGFRMNNKLFFPLLAALGWTFYTSLTNFVVKTQVLTPFQWMFYCEFSITLIIVAAFFITSARDNKFDFSINKRQLGFNMLISFFIFLWALDTFLAYNSAPWNYVNVICLSQIPLLSLFSYFFLKDKLKKSEIYTITWAFLVLLVFLIV